MIVAVRLELEVSGRELPAVAEIFFFQIEMLTKVENSLRIR